MTDRPKRWWIGGEGGNIYSYRNENSNLPGPWFILAVLAACVLILAIMMGTAHAEDWTDEAVVEAIYKAEGGPKAVKPFGILSVPCDGYDSCRRICLNTVRNNRKRFAKQSLFTDYLEFLASRYAPIGAENDPTNLNKNWLKNVRYFLERGA